MSILDRLTGHRDRSSTGGPKPEIAQQKVLDTLQNDLHVKPLETLTPEEARRQPSPADAVKKILAGSIDKPDPSLGIVTRDFTIPGAAGEIPARLYGPENKGIEDGRLLPVVVYWHGGGWVIADIDTYDASARAISSLADCIVVSCHYRQAPEHRFPAAHEDAFTAYRWVLENAQQFGGDPQKIAVMGESAGGNLAANVAIMARDQGVRAPIHQVLVYPVAGNDMSDESYRENADARPLGKAGMEWFVRHVFRDPAETADTRINLVEADLRNLPSATVINAEIDPLRSGGELLAERLERAGVAVRQKTFHGVTHEFFGMAPVVPDATAAQQFAAHDLKQAFDAARRPM